MDLYYPIAHEGLYTFSVTVPKEAVPGNRMYFEVMADLSKKYVYGIRITRNNGSNVAPNGTITVSDFTGTTVSLCDRDGRYFVQDLPVNSLDPFERIRPEFLFEPRRLSLDRCFINEMSPDPSTAYVVTFFVMDRPRPLEYVLKGLRGQFSIDSSEMIESIAGGSARGGRIYLKADKDFVRTKVCGIAMATDSTSQIANNGLENSITSILVNPIDFFITLVDIEGNEFMKDVPMALFDEYYRGNAFYFRDRFIDPAKSYVYISPIAVMTLPSAFSIYFIQA